MDAKPKKLKHYLTSGLRDPYGEWMDAHKKQKIFGIIEGRLKRVSNGNFGHTRAVGNGVIELKISVGPGYRVYVGIDGDDVILLLAGDKSSQNADIQTAKEYWGDYNA